MKRKRKSKKPSGEHKTTAEARQRVLRVAQRRGYITNRQACLVGKWTQGFYHLNAMRKAGLLKRDGFNVWVPR